VEPIKTLNDDDVAILARTAYGEGRGETDPNSRLAIMYSLLNRARGSRAGRSLQDIAWEPHQYSSWSVGNPNREQMLSFGPEHPDWEPYAAQARAALEGKVPDPTGGAEFFVTPKVLEKPPSWLQNLQESARVGGHVFFKAPKKVKR
jgi:spore germination cell wall hydrolase CwlJ-like protein